jgi:adenylate kinase
MKMVRLILFGAPGSGKGTQADSIENKYGYKKISTGDLVRVEVSAKTKLGLEIKSITERGELVPDETIIKILKKRLKQADIKNGYIMDGFPRTRHQAEELSRMEVDSEVAIYLKIFDEDVIVKRLLSRLTCTNPTCGAIFNLENNPSQKTGQCDFCGSPIKQRADDNEETVTKRIEVYREQTKPVIDYYKHKGEVYEIDASRTIEEVFESIIGILN